MIGFDIIIHMRFLWKIFASLRLLKDGMPKAIEKAGFGVEFWIWSSTGIVEHELYERDAIIKAMES